MSGDAVRAALRGLATRGLRPHASVAAAMASLRFVQYDPIRRPARAQDLVLRARVPDYHLGGLDAQYEALGLDEGWLHVYGAMSTELAGAVRRCRIERRGGIGSAVERALLEHLDRHGRISPQEAARCVGRTAVGNDWGGSSLLGTRTLERLHAEGLLRIRKRTRGTKVYARATPAPSGPDGPARPTELLVDALFRLLAPMTATGLHAVAAQLRRTAEVELDVSAAVARAMAGAPSLTLDGKRWAWPDDCPIDATASDDPYMTVRFLAPFDPVVWDRRRFAALWGWTYRFEAYTPATRRVFGYYAMPVLWGERAVGVVTAERDGATGRRIAFTPTVPGSAEDPAFIRAYRDEEDRFRHWLAHDADDCARCG